MFSSVSDIYFIFACFFFRADVWVFNRLPVVARCCDWLRSDAVCMFESEYVRRACEGARRRV